MVNRGVEGCRVHRGSCGRHLGISKQLWHMYSFSPRHLVLAHRNGMPNDSGKAVEYSFGCPRIQIFSSIISTSVHTILQPCCLQPFSLFVVLRIAHVPVLDVLPLPLRIALVLLVRKSQGTSSSLTPRFIESQMKLEDVSKALRSDQSPCNSATSS